MDDSMDDVLGRAIAAERGAIVKYKAMANKANEDGFPNVARVFAALVEAEGVHVKNHQQALGRTLPGSEDNAQSGAGGRTTLDNVLEAKGGELEEFKVMYPAFIKAIGKGKTMEEKVAKLSLAWARDAEQQHAELLEIAAGALARGEDLPPGRVYFCTACGTLHYGDPPTDVCPVCKHDAMFYKEVA